MAIKRALFLSTGDRYFALACNFATVAAMSRLLTPEEIGISVIGMAVVGIALAAREFVSTSFLIQRQHLSREDVRATFTAMLVVTAIIGSALAFAAPALAELYGEPNLTPYLHVTAACLFVDLAGIQIGALLRREMAFGKVAAVNASGVAVGAVATVWLAWAGFSYMSFAWGWLATSVVTAVVALWLQPHFWMFVPSFRHWRELAEFGGYNCAIGFLNKANEQLPFLLLGRFLSPQAAALFNRGMMVCQIPDKVVLGGAISVVLPAFAAQVRQGGDLKQPYLRSLEMITAFHWPALLVLAVLAYPLVDLLLGSQWDDAAPLVQIIALASLCAFSFELNYPVMVAVGSIRTMFVRTLIVVPVSAALMTVGVLTGGLHGAALSTLLIMPFKALVTMGFVRHRLGLTWLDLAAAVRKSAVLAGMAAAGPLAAVALAGFTFDLSLGQAVIAIVVAACGWIAGLLLVRHPLLGELAGISSAIRRRMGPRMGAAAALSKD
ncbi:sugar transporter [Azorhizobium oxalatiphilum]|uniref:Sugar transporter n=1 Tax=Azorhizobium oxalatiphilum TaxID=980631 RepID=A0A917BPW8_9HYPH|nr:oligosaccharide flippase family protein [Azorhizobium oxalatiphilum]GGF54405.1 sugar transporter [Azorhizobium oxalatiphilum]